MSWGRELSDGTLCFPQRGDPPAVKQGYQRDPGNPYNLIPILVSCKFRSTGYAPCDCPGGNQIKFLACKHGLPLSARYCQTCPIRVEGESEEDTKVMRAMWRELHMNREPTIAWWNQFVDRIPCADCQAHTKAYSPAPPLRPKSLDPNEFFEWGVKFHNSVNERKGKPILSMEEARRLYPR